MRVEVKQMTMASSVATAGAGAELQKLDQKGILSVQAYVEAPIQA